MIERPSLRFLADSFVDQHVGIDRHADRQHDAGNARQRQRRLQQNDGGENQADVHGEREIGEYPEGAIGRQHVDDDEDGADIGRALAGIDRILAEARTHGALLDDGQFRRQRAGAQQNGEIIRLLDGEIAGNLAGAAGDRAEDARRRNHLVVEHDGEGLADILAGHLAELLAAANVEAEIHHRLAGARIKAGLRIGEIFALHHDAAFRPAAVPGWSVCRQHVDIGRDSRRGRRRGGIRAWPSCREFPSAAAVSCRPGTSTRTRSSPSRWMFGSVVPSASTRRRSTSID